MHLSSADWSRETVLQTYMRLGFNTSHTRLGPNLNHDAFRHKRRNEELDCAKSCEVHGRRQKYGPDLALAKNYVSILILRHGKTGCKLR